jgi:hypothetical protein
MLFIFFMGKLTTFRLGHLYHSYVSHYHLGYLTSHRSPTARTCHPFRNSTALASQVASNVSLHNPQLFHQGTVKKIYRASHIQPEYIHIAQKNERSPTNIWLNWATTMAQHRWFMYPPYHHIHPIGVIQPVLRMWGLANTIGITRKWLKLWCFWWSNPNVSEWLRSGYD